jgi:hypothetical protein
MFNGKEFQSFAPSYLNVDWPEYQAASYPSGLCCACMQRLDMNVSQLARAVQVVQYLENTCKA